MPPRSAAQNSRRQFRRSDDVEALFAPQRTPSRELPDPAPLVAEHILLVEGTGFNWPTPDHLRVVTLPEARVLSEAIERLGNFLSSYRQG